VIFSWFFEYNFGNGLSSLRRGRADQPPAPSTTSVIRRLGSTVFTRGKFSSEGTLGGVSVLGYRAVSFAPYVLFRCLRWPLSVSSRRPGCVAVSDPIATRFRCLRPLKWYRNQRFNDKCGKRLNTQI
jgi:hypothetical protein